MDANVRRLPPAPVPNGYDFDDTPFQTAEEAEQDVQANGVPLFEGAIRHGIQASLWACAWLERGGPQMVGPKQPHFSPPEGVQVRPMSDYDRGVRWAARQIGLRDKSSFYRAARTGAIRKAVVARAPLPALKVSERALTPLATLLPAISGPNTRPDQSDKIGPAFMAALDTAQAENKPLSAMHVKAGIRKVLGQPPPEPLTFEQSVQAAIMAILERLQRKGQHPDTERALTQAWESLQ